MGENVVCGLKNLLVGSTLNRRPREKLNFDSPKTCFFNMFL